MAAWSVGVSCQRFAVGGGGGGGSSWDMVVSDDLGRGARPIFCTFAQWVIVMPQCGWCYYPLLTDGDFSRVRD